MARPRRVDTEWVTQAQAAVRDADNVEALRCVQAVLLPAQLGATLEQTAAARGVRRATVPRLQARMRRLWVKPDAVRPNWGGRRRASLTPEEEDRFLAPKVQAASEGEILVVSPLRAALVQKLGYPVAASVVYRLLVRHGWRKFAPDTRHPKSEKNCPKHWQPF